MQARLGGHAGDLTDLAFSPAGTRLVTTSVDRDARLWRARTGERLRVLRGHFGTVFSASFSPDGRWIVTAGPGSGGLWRADTGRLLLYLRGHTKPLAAARFDASGRWIATAGRDGDMRLYRCDVCAPTATLLKLARLRLATAGRALTPAERRRYLDAA